MYPCFDQPDLKSTFTFTAIAPSHWEVLSNNPLAKKTNLGTSSKWEFTKTPVMSTYITAIVAGPYARIEDVYVGQKRIPLGLFCRKSLAQYLDAPAIFEVTKQGFAYFEKVFGLAYPFEK